MKISGGFRSNLAWDAEKVARDIRNMANDHDNEMTKAEKSRLLKISGDMYAFAGSKGAWIFEKVEDESEVE